MKTRKILGLAVIALALTAFVGVSSASASGFVNPVAPAYIQSTGSTNLTVNGYSSIKCTGPTFTSTSTKKHPGELSTNSIEKATCNGGFSSLSTGGCQLTFHSGSKSVEGNRFEGTFDIGPAGCSPIKLQSAGCYVTFGAQSGFAITYTNLGEGSSANVLAVPHATGLKFTSSGSACGESGENATLTGEWTMKGYANEAHTSQNSFQVASDYGLGLYLAGEKSAEEAKQPKLSSEQYPVTISGAQGAPGSKEIKFTTGSGVYVKCGTGLFSGTASGSTASQLLTASFSGCSTAGQKSTVAMNSCSYVLQVANAGPPYSGSAALTCSKEGDAVKVTVGSPTVVCTISIPAQTIAAASYENLGAFSGRQVLATLTGSGLSYTSSGSVCGSSGSNGTLSGTITLSGSSSTFE